MAGEKIVFVTGADRGLGFALTGSLLERGWRVFAGQFIPDWPDLKELAKRYPDRLTPVLLNIGIEDSAQAAAQQVGQRVDHLDVLVNNAGVISPVERRTIREDPDYAEMHREFDINALGALRVVEAFLPLMDRGATKRLCFISSEASSIARARRNAWFGYCMSKAALNMGVKILFNDLRPQGYTFRVYHPGWMRSYMSGKKNNQADLEPKEAAVPALAYFLSGVAGESKTQLAPDEDRLALRDYQGQEWPW